MADVMIGDVIRVLKISEMDKEIKKKRVRSGNAVGFLEHTKQKIFVPQHITGIVTRINDGICTLELGDYNANEGFRNYKMEVQMPYREVEKYNILLYRKLV